MTLPKLDMSFNLQNFLTAMAIAGGLVAWGMRIESRISVVESTVAAQKEIDKRQDAEKDRSQDQVRADLKEIQAKLDRLIERRR
ncbi:hypothetical protein [Mesoterricola sediminis]|uniref:Uncharacterized protein n=1 Tax=Mesoterricola sediminis TaxID=2927980 RepID=A0AA48GND1_9BACT|nr:hypothetical protein [Mesoterricola sediminis]BDU76286.1 hypothetical protein METESE_12440 [Mesoterricola sediminis]